MRIVRHCNAPDVLASQYCQALGFQLFTRFDDRDGYSAAIAGWPGAAWHVAFVSAPEPPRSAPSTEEALVIYEPDAARWQARAEALRQAGFHDVTAPNPYWETHGASFADREGFRLILVRQAWDR